MENSTMETSKQEISDLLNMPLPNNWVVYLYDKQVFRDIAGLKKKPHTEICKLETMNDAIYFIQLMSIKNTVKLDVKHKINLDMHDYIIMREGIEPIWEDPKNCNGGTFTIKMPHSKGFTVWSMFMMYMLGETMTYDMESINGITVSFIADGYNSSSNNCTYVKIWDASKDGSVDKFTNILPRDLYDKIKPSSNLTLRYTFNNSKKNYGNDKIIEKLAESSKNRKADEYDRKSSSRGGRGRGGYRGGKTRGFSDDTKGFSKSGKTQSYNSHGSNVYESLIN